MNYVCIGYSISSFNASDHATIYRALLGELTRAGNNVLFLEKISTEKAQENPVFNSSICELGYYSSFTELKSHYADVIAVADVVIVGSNLDQGSEIGKWVIATAQGVKAFYDFETPVTVAKLKRGDFSSIDPVLVNQYDLYLSCTGGPILDYIENYFGASAVRPLYGCVDTTIFFPEPQPIRWELGYSVKGAELLQPKLELLLSDTAMALAHRRFALAGNNFLDSIQWPSNVERFTNLQAEMLRKFYNSQLFALNVTRVDMVSAGYSPGVGLFEAAACGVPIISDYCEGLTTIFANNTEILIAQNTNEVQYFLKHVDSVQRYEIAQNALSKVREHHTAKVRAKQLKKYIQEIIKRKEKRPKLKKRKSA